MKDIRGIFNKYEQLNIQCNAWHQLANETDSPLKIIEVQYGEHCVEDDIVRIE
jgi:mannose-6-phosphate isomerase-like protein (cupin superfamily)